MTCENMTGGIEGERPRGELTPEQKQNSPQAGEGLRGSESDRNINASEEGKKRVEQEQQPKGGVIKSPKLDLPGQAEALEDMDKERIEAIQSALKGAGFYSGVGLGDIPLKHKGKEGKSG